MKDIIGLFVANLVTLVCVGIAAWLVMHDKGGWGWFLFIGFICAHMLDSKKD
jgi:hypothetical protein